MSLYTQIRDAALDRARQSYPNHEGAKREVLDSHTVKSIKAITKKFADWVKMDGRYTRRDLFTTDKGKNRAREALQDYQRYLSVEYRKANGGKLSPATVHTYLAYACTALGVSMAEIKKEARTADTITRSRRSSGTQNSRGDREAKSPRFERLVTFQNAVGLRRGELEALTPADLVRDESGYICIHVKGGKGGKEQLQRILPTHEAIVTEIMSAGGNTVFSEEEMKNKIDLHGMRAMHGMECYRYYASRLESDPAYKEQLRHELRARYFAFNKKPTAQHRHKFEKDITNETPYRLRRNEKNYAIAERDGKPVIYNRLALMAVSVLHLSHWRLDVTVTNYVLGGHK